MLLSSSCIAENIYYVFLTANISHAEILISIYSDRRNYFGYLHHNTKQN